MTKKKTPKKKTTTKAPAKRKAAKKRTRKPAVPKRPEDKQPNGKQKLFIRHYLANGFNATGAARKAGYKSSFSEHGYKNLRKPHIRARIDTALADFVMSEEEALARLAQSARGFDITQYAKIREQFGVDRKGDQYFAGFTLEIDLEGIKRDGFGSLIKKISASRRGVTIEQTDPQKALSDVGRALALFTDIQIQGKLAEPPTDIKDVRDTVRDRIKRLGKKKRST